jgi:predicted nucleic acid-binding protein
MSASIAGGRGSFFDSNVVLYLLSSDQAKADRAEALLAQGGCVSVQVLNEVANVARRKLGLAWSEVQDVCGAIAQTCSIEPLSLDSHRMGLQLGERFGLSVYDAMIVASALLAGCRTLFSEDLQDGLVVERSLTVRNPFAVK